MKNKLLSFVLTAMACLISPCLSAETYNGTCGENLTWTLDTETGVLTISGTGSMGGYLDAYDSYYNLSPWIDYNSAITSVVITDGVTSIIGGAFVRCGNLTSITIPKSVTFIGANPFEYCVSLTAVNISDIAAWCEMGFFDFRSNPLYYAHNLYLNGTLVTDLVIPNSVTYIVPFAFQNCSTLTSITIPNSVTTIGNYAFSDCSSLTSATIGNNVTSIGEGAFCECSSLTSATIGNSVSSLEYHTFYNCTNLTSVTLGCKKINKDAFNSCYNLESIVWNGKGNILIQYESEAPLYNLRSQITSISFGSDVDTIPTYLCAGMTKLTSVTIPQNVKAIGYDAFKDCSALTTVNIDDLSAWCHISFYSPYANPLCLAHRLYMKGKEVTELKIPKNTKTIGGYAFITCTSLTSVSISNTVTSIGGDAFGGCSSLTSITIPNSVTSIGEKAFGGCSSLISITIPNSVTSLGEYAFYNCSSLTSIEIPNSVTSIGKYTFSNCSGLTSVTIPNSVTSIGERAFADCSSLTSIAIPGGVTTIEDRALLGCSALKSVIWNAKKCNDFSSNKTPFYYSGGYDNYDLRTQISSFTFGDDVECVPAYLCSGMSNLTSVTISNSVSSIGNYAFSGCSGLTSITIPNGITNIGTYAFYGCSGLISVVWNAEKINDFSYNSTPFYQGYGYDLRTQITSFTFGDNIKHIPAYLCSDMTNIKSITIPGSVTSIGEGAFYGCKFSEIYFTGNMELWLNKLWNPQQITSEHYTLYVENKKVSDVVIPNSIKDIKAYAFYNCGSLSSVDIHNSVTSIEEGAFCGCSGLTSITFPQNLTSIGTYAFYGCNGLTSVVWNAGKISDYSYDSTPFYQGYEYDLRTQITSFIFGDNIEHIPAYLCSGMSKLTSVTIPGSVTSIGESAFYNCSSLTSITIPNNVTSIGESAFAGCGELASVIWNAKKCNDFSYRSPFNDSYTQITSFTFGDKVEYIPAYLCSGMSKLTSVIIPKSIKSIGDNAFYDCSGLASVNIPNNITSIGNYAFSGCSGLTSASIPNSITSIGDGTFSSCSSLTSITIPNSVTNIGHGAFYICSSLTSVTIPNSVTSIGGEAFSGCSSLSSITIPGNVTSIGSSAFENCTSLTAVHISDLAAWCAIDFGKYEYMKDVYYYSATANPLYYAKHLFLDGDEIKELEIPAGVKDINPYAFVNGSGLTSVRLPQSVETIGKGAFEGCSAVKRIYCHAVTPPAVELESFANYNAYLYVPCANFEDYDLHDVWGSFKHIECLPEDVTALNDPITGQQSSQAKKILRNGTICIERDGILYDLQGTIIQ